MLKEILKQKNISIYKLAQNCGIPYSTLNDIVNYKVDVKNIRAGILFELAKALQISMDELYRICDKEIQIFSKKYATNGIVFIRNKKYVLKFNYHDKEYIKELYPVKKEATMFIDSIAVWDMEDKISDIEMEELYEIYLKEKG